MQIDRNLANCLLEIKRNLPKRMQKQFKISAPNIEELVMAVHQSTDDDRLKRLTTSFLFSADSKRAKPDDDSQLSDFDWALNKSSTVIDKVVSRFSNPLR